jgi:FtsZ-interacting cell division protein ZipA
MNWPILIVVALALIALVIFIIRRNQKDEKKFEEQLNSDYPKPKEDESDVDAEEITK